MKRIVIVALTIVALIALTAAHVWLWFTLLFLFEIDSPAGQWVLGIVLGVLAVGFLPSTYLVHKKENIFTSYIYTVMATWLGAALYISMATVLAVLLLWLFPLTEYRLLVSTALLAAGLGYAGYGIWNAQYPQIKRMALPSSGFPASWHNKKIVHLSDVHLGVIHHIRFMRRVVHLVEKEQPDIIFITGDLYDGVGRELGYMANPLKALHPADGMYFIIGNHETYVGLDNVFAALEGLPMTILRNDKVEVDGVQILGIDFHLPGKKFDEREVIDTLDSNRPSIVLYHEPKSDVIRYCVEKNVQLVLCGHTHKGQLWPFNLITRKMYDQFHVGYTRSGNTGVYTSPGVGSWGPPLRTGNRPQIGVFTID